MSSKSTENPAEAQASSSSSSGCSSLISGFIDKITRKEKEKIDTLFARAMYATSSSLRLLENPYWKGSFQALWPSYTPPTRYQLSTTLLNKEYELVQKLMQRKIKSADCITIMPDGWTDINGTALINIIFATPEPVYYKCIDSKTQAHTGEYIAQILDDAIQVFGRNKVFGLVTDNAANYEASMENS